MADQATIHDNEFGEDLTWVDTVREPFDRESWGVTLKTDRGDVPARYHPIPVNGAESIGGVVWVGGAGGGLDGPQGLYPKACKALQRFGVAGLRLDYRCANHLEECVLDTLLGVEFLAQEGVQRIVLVGHSFGGAVVISAGAISKSVRAVAPIATQTYGTDLAPRLAPRPLLLIHGMNDNVLPDICSRRVFAAAKEPKELKLFPAAGHCLEGAGDEPLKLLLKWIPEQLRKAETAERAALERGK